MSTYLALGSNLAREMAMQGQPVPYTILLPGVGMILVALTFVAYALIRRLGFRHLLFGALAWGVTVALKIGWAGSVNAGVHQALTTWLPEQLGLLVFEVYVGLLTGVFEVALLWIFLSRTRFGRTPWSTALSFGIGFGSVEALLLGVSSLASALAALRSPDLLPPSALAQIGQAANPLFGLAPVVERVAAIFLHIFACVLIFYAIRAGEKRWFWAAFFYKSAMDTVAAFAQFWGVATLAHLWTIEGVIVLFGLVGVWGIRRISARYEVAGSAEPLPPEPIV